MKNTKKLFLSVFALSAMILSACSGSQKGPDTSSTAPAPGTSSTEPAPTPASSSELPPEESSSVEPSESSSVEPSESSSGGGEESSSSEPVVFNADYQIEIGNAKYDLFLNEGQTLHTKEYYFGADVSKTVAAGEIITFKKYQNNEYQSFAVAPSPDDETGLTYNNVVKDGNDYKIRASGSVGVYLKLDGTDWSYWITGGGDMEDPFYTGYRLAYGEDEDDPTWAFDNAVVGVEAPSTEEDVVKQLKFSIEVGANAIGAKVTNGGEEWYGAGIAQPEAYHSDLLPEPNIQLEAGGNYDIYFKLLTSGAHEIWVAKYGPASFTSLYYQVNDGQITAFEHRTEPTSLENQFYIENVALEAGDELGVYFDQAGTQSALPVFSSDDMMTAICLSGESSDPLAVGVTIDGTYNFYFNEGIGQTMASPEPTNILKVYTVRAEGTPKTNIQLTVPANLPELEGKKIYLAGDWAVNWDDIIELTPNDDRTVWSGQFTFTKLNQSYKYIIWDGGEGEKDWDFLNPGNRQAVAVFAVKGIEDTFNPTPTEKVYKVLGAGGVWDYNTNTAVFAKDEDEMPTGVLHQWSIEIDLAKDTQFKINDGVSLWLGFTSLDAASPALANFSKNEEAGDDNNNVIVDVAGTYIIYLKQYETYINFYIVEKGSEPVATVYKVLGAGGVWDYATNTVAFAVDETSKPDNVLHQWSVDVTFAKDEQFKVSDGASFWQGYDEMENGGAKSNFSKNEEAGDDNNNVIVDVAGTYKIYLKQYDTYFKFYISATGDTPVTPTETVYKVLGAGGVWDYNTNTAVFAKDEDEMPTGVLHQWSIEIDLAKDTQFKINDGVSLWLGFTSLDAASPALANFSKNEEAGDDNNNVIVDVAGTYIIYLKQYETYINFYIVEKGSEPPAPPVEAKVTFRIKMDASDLDVYVAGNFNDWNATQYKLTESDTSEHIYSIDVNIPTGNYLFKFIKGSLWEENIENRPLSLTADVVTPIYQFNSTEVVGEYYMLLGRDSTWDTSNKLSANSGATEYSILNVTLNANDLINFNLNGNWKGYSDLKLSEYAQARFTAGEEDNNIKVLTAGTYDIYVKVAPETEGEYEGKSIWIGEHIVVTTLNVTFNVTLPAGSANDISYVGVKYITGDSGEYAYLGSAANNDGVWSLNNDDKISLSGEDKDFKFFVEIYSPTLGSNAEVVANVPWTAFTVTVTDVNNPVVVNITTNAPVTTSGPNVGTGNGTNCTVA